MDQLFQFFNSNDTVVCCGPCEKIYPKKYFLKHLSHAKNCKDMYAEEVYLAMKAENKKQSSNAWKGEEKEASKDSSDETLIPCKGKCKRKIPRNSILNHVIHAKKCKSHYTDDEILEMQFESNCININKTKQANASKPFEERSAKITFLFGMTVNQM